MFGRDSFCFENSAEFAKLRIWERKSWHFFHILL